VEYNITIALHPRYKVLFSRFYQFVIPGTFIAENVQLGSTKDLSFVYYLIYGVMFLIRTETLAAENDAKKSQVSKSCT